jgi:hypothetical protein
MEVNLKCINLEQCIKTHTSKRADLKDSNEKSGPLFKITSDPRIINWVRVSENL